MIKKIIFLGFLISLVFTPLTNVHFAASVQEVPRLKIDQTENLLLSDIHHISVEIKNIIQPTVKDDWQHLNEFFQKKCLRSQGVERWQMEKKFSGVSAKLIPLFSKIDFFSAVYPQKDHYDTLVIYGSTVENMRDRLGFLFEYMKTKSISFKKVVFLTGERPLDSKIEGKEVLLKIDHPTAPFESLSPSSLKENMTESDAAEFLWKNLKKPKELNDTPIIFIRVPILKEFGKDRRPTTLDTIIYWLKDDKNPGRCLAISSAPYILRQHLLLSKFLPKNVNLETVGAGSSSGLEEKNIDLALDEWARLVNTVIIYYGDSLTHAY